MKELFLFTATFPYGVAESFIETEIIFLSKEFDRVVIIPTSGKGLAKRTVPTNCEVLEPVVKSKWQRYLFGLYHSKTFIVFMKDFVRKKVYKNFKRLKIWLVAYYITNLFLKSKSVMVQLKDASDNDIIYFYWGVGSSLLTPFLTENKAKKIVRFHGEWDLWEESSGGYAALRSEVANSIDLAAFISKAGLNYFNQKYSDISLKKSICYLGTVDHGISQHSDDGIFRLLSCSGVIPLKRVHLIFESLQLIDGMEIEWTHIGDGIGFKELSQHTKASKSNVKINLIGSIPNKDVFNFYRNHRIDAFINVSSTEGLPVTLMEAISFNVPIIATNVGGTSEIVNSETGILLSSNPSCQEIVKALFEIQKHVFNPKSFWNKNFNAKINYPEFISQITSL
jgi:colanic acid/amylovoran biosynthesis glycosyltransferase